MKTGIFSLQNFENQKPKFFKTRLSRCRFFKMKYSKEFSSFFEKRYYEILSLF